MIEFCTWNAGVELAALGTYAVLPPNLRVFDETPQVAEHLSERHLRGLITFKTHIDASVVYIGVVIGKELVNGAADMKTCPFRYVITCTHVTEKAL